MHLVSLLQMCLECKYFTGLMNGTTYWLGARKRNNVWQWEDGRTPFVFMNWRSGQPDNCCGTDVSCILVNYITRDGQWEDAGCDDIHRSPQSYICKRFV